MAQPRILIWDIETSPMLGNIWRMWKENISLNQLREDWMIISWSAKWLGSDEVLYADCRHSMDDKQILIQLKELLDTADWSITHNGDKFDLPKVRARMVIQGLEPFAPVRSIDTCQQAKRVFGFTSNKLEYISNVLAPEMKKSKHLKFPGFTLWEECMKGNPEAWNEMEEYNKQDVKTLEAVYLAMRPWMTQHPNFALHDDTTEEAQCPKCGSTHLHKRGFSYTGVSKFQRLRCVDCGSWSRERYTLVEPTARRSVLTHAL